MLSLSRQPLVLAGAALLAASNAACDGCSRTSGSASADAEVDAAAAADAGPMNATPVPTASVAALVNPQNLPAYSGPTGSVEGTVTITGDPPPASPGDFRGCPDAEKTWGHYWREGPPKTPGGPRPLADAIVAVTGYSGFYLPQKDEAAEITIEGCGFTRRTVAMTYGQRIDVKNLTNEFWTPMLEPGANLVMMMAAPKGDPVKVYPKKPGHYLLVDHDRKYAVVDLYTFLHPLHTTTKIDGSFRIDGIPVGKLKVNTTHPRLVGESSADIDVKPGLVQRVDLKLEHHDKDGGRTYDSGIEYPKLH